MVNTAATSLLENSISLQIVYDLMTIRCHTAPEMIPTHCPHSGSGSLLLPAGRLPFRVVKVQKEKRHDCICILGAVGKEKREGYHPSRLSGKWAVG